MSPYSYRAFRERACSPKIAAGSSDGGSSAGTDVCQRKAATASQTAASVPRMPTRIAVISDIHANLHALEAVLAAIDADGVDEIWCLGDIVGYGPRPNECAALVRERAAVCLAGNHDLVVLGKIDERRVRRRGCGGGALDDTRARARRARVPPLARAPRRGRGRAALPRQSARSDLGLRPERAGDAASFAATSAPLVLVGHSHVALGIASNAGELYGGQAPDGDRARARCRPLLLNPGSVGQPRDGDPRAAWLEIDKARQAARARFRRTDYPVEQTQAEMRERGLPEALAARLSYGV